MSAEKVPEFLRTARKLSPRQWDKLIEQAKRMASDKGPQTGEMSCAHRTPNEATRSLSGTLADGPEGVFAAGEMPGKPMV